MIHIEKFNKQHDTISVEIHSILAEVEKEASLIDASSAALHISILAGQLKMHLIHEDKFLYPDLLKCSDIKIQELTKQYIIEMGNLAEEYIKYKNNYYTRNKINENVTGFIHDTKMTMKALKIRMEKEDNELYRLISERSL